MWPGQTDQLDTPLDPISGTGCSQTRVDATGSPISTRPELLQVRKVTDAAGNTNRADRAGPVLRSTDTAAANRRIALDADFIGPACRDQRPGGHVNLTDKNTGTVTTLTRANGGILKLERRQPTQRRTNVSR